MRARRREKPIFRGFAIAVAGDFGDLGGGQWTDANIARWIGLRGGRFAGRAPPPTRTVTHLVCTAEAFRAGTGRDGVFRDVLQRGSSTQIVELDWLEDSLHQQKRLDEAPYSHLRAFTVEREREKRRLRNLKGQEQAVRTVNPNLYHVYRDQTYFQYSVLLTRDNEDEGIQGERYVLTIYESNAAQPHLYWFIVKYYKKKGDTHAKVHRPSNAPGVFSRAFAQFESFFFCKTGVPWAQRLVGAGAATAATAEKKLFRYTPPRGGKPVGWVPAEFVPADDPADGESGQEEESGEKDESGEEENGEEYESGEEDDLEEMFDDPSALHVTNVMPMDAE